MEEEQFYHMFANGDDAKNFITSKNDFRLAFNRVGVCSYATGATVVAFSIEDSHPHILLWGTERACMDFKKRYESCSIRSIVQHRGNADDVVLKCELYPVTDEDYLMKVAAYVILQPTKDGKAVMQYDYLYGSGPLYFRSRYTVLPWLVNEDGTVSSPEPFRSLTYREKLRICGSRTFVPDNWLVCNGFILPQNYVDICRFERIYRTHNCFRVYSCSKKKDDVAILSRMSQVRGVDVEDLEARRLCRETCSEMFSRNGTRHLNTRERIALANTLRLKYHLSLRQLSFLVHISESELAKYVR